MASPTETEIKLAANPAVLDELRHHPLLAGEDHVSALVTTYFDTVSGKLRRGGASLRIRHDGQKRVQTMKVASAGKGGVRRGEWTAQSSGDHPDSSEFPEAARSFLIRLLDGGLLEPVATTSVQRTARKIHFGASAIEVAFDAGAITAGVREAPIYELELELVEGRLADVLSLARDLPLGPALTWSVHSKAERCHELAFDLLPSAVRAQSLKMARGTHVAAGLQAIAWNCLDQLLANYQLVIDAGDPEAVHQSRVAIRRLRAAFSLFGNIMDDPALPILRAELKAVANALGPARDLDVLVRQVRQSKSAAAADSDLVDHLEALRADAVRAAQAMLATGEFQRLLFDIAIWIENGKWLAQGDETGSGLALAQFARSELSRRRRKLKAAAGKIAGMSDADRHRLRIRIKKLRYASEFFASLFPGRVASNYRRSFARSLSCLQDSLGELNDIAVASARQHAWFEGLESITAARLAAELGEVLDERHKSRRKLVKLAERSLNDMVAVPAWWKAG